MNALAVADAPVLIDEAAVLRRIAVWLPGAFPHERADAVNALARALLHSGLGPEARAEAELVLTRALDDPEPRVRRALAEAWADAREAPRALVLALAADVGDVAYPVLARSPLLNDADLVDCAAAGDARTQRAVARRPRLAAPVCAALAEIGERDAVLALLGNLGAEIAKPALWRAFERFASDPELRERLLERRDVSPALRAAVAAATADDMSKIAADARWLAPRRAERLARDGREQAFVALARTASPEELTELVAWLRDSRHMTIALLVRALACGETALVAHGLADMAGVAARRASGLLRDPFGQGFAALYARAGLPEPLFPAFRVAVACAVEADATACVDSRLTTKMLRGVEALEDAALEPFVSMLWRLAAEGARADAREAALLAPETETAEEPLEAEESAAPALQLNVEPGNENFAPPVEIDAPVAVAA